MSKIIIFDFNRTIYDPEKQSLTPGIVDLLENLSQAEYGLHLVSMAADSRAELIKQLGIESFFTSITLCSQKTLKLFTEILDAASANPQHSYVVGDRVKKEIRLGNELGLRTIWFKNGRFAEEEPEHYFEQPTFTVSNINEIWSVVQNNKTTIP